MSDYQETIDRNPVLKRMYELASLQYGGDRVIVRHVVPREIVPDEKYVWELYEFPSDPAPVDTVTVAVGLARKMEIDEEVSIELHRA